MKTSTVGLVALSAVSRVVSGSPVRLATRDYGYQFSNALSTGPTADNSWIREANTTLILPAVNRYYTNPHSVE